MQATAHMQAQALDRLERRKQVVMLSRDGFSLREIGTMLAVSHETVRLDLLAARTSVEADLKDVAAHFVVESIALLWKLVDVFGGKALTGDARAAEVVDKLIHRGGSLLGAYPKDGQAPAAAPTIHITVPILNAISTAHPLPVPDTITLPDELDE